MYYKRINARPYDRSTLEPHLHEWTTWVGVVIQVKESEVKKEIRPVVLVGSLTNLNGYQIELDHVNMVVGADKVDLLTPYRVVTFTAKVYRYQRGSKVWLSDLKQWVPYTSYNYGLEEPRKYIYDGWLKHHEHLSMYIQHRLASLIRHWGFSDEQRDAMQDCLLAMPNNGSREWRLQQWWLTCQAGRKKDVSRFIHQFIAHPYGELWKQQRLEPLPELKDQMQPASPRKELIE